MNNRYIDELIEIRNRMTAVFNTAEPFFVSKIGLDKVEFGDGAFIQGIETEEDDNMTALWYWSAEGTYLDYHYHEFQDELFTVIRGEVRLYIEGKIVNLKRGDCYYIPRNNSHAVVFNKDSKLLLLFKPAFPNDNYQAKF